MPQLLDLLPVMCATSGVCFSAPGMEGLAQGIRALMPGSLRCSAGRGQRGHPVWRSRQGRRSSEPCPLHTRLHSGQGLHIRLQAAAAKRQRPPFKCAAKLLQSCLTLCHPIDGSPSGSPVPGILQARTLAWVAISFSNA